MMASINLLGRIKSNILLKLFLPISQKKPLPTIEFLKKTLPPLPLGHPPKPQVEHASIYLGFGHIATNFPTKRTMMVRGGGVVVSEHSSQSSSPIS